MDVARGVVGSPSISNWSEAYTGAGEGVGWLTATHFCRSVAAAMGREQGRRQLNRNPENGNLSATYSGLSCYLEWRD